MLYIERGNKLMYSPANSEYFEIVVNQLVEINVSDETYIKGPITEIDFEAEGFWVKDTSNSDELYSKWNEKYNGQVYFYLCDIKKIRILNSLNE